MVALTEQRSKEEVVKQFREEALTDAVRRLVAQEGVAGVTIERVAELAGVSKGTIYLYFKNKDELVRATVVASIDRLHKAVKAATEAEATYPERLRAVVTTHLAHLDENFAFFRDMLSTPELRATAGCSNKDDVLSRHMKYMSVLTDVIEYGKAQGLVRANINAGESAFFLLHLMQANAIRRLLELSDEPLASEEAIERLLQFFQHGVADT